VDDKPQSEPPVHIGTGIRHSDTTTWVYRSVYIVLIILWSRLLEADHVQLETTPMFVPDRFKKNAFRALRLPTEATRSDIHQAAGDLRRAAILDAIIVSEADIPALGEIPRCEIDIRAAVGRIDNAALRIIDRLFWFDSLGVTASDGSSPNKHDLALRALFDALSGNLDEERVWMWARALRRWHQIVLDDDYWAHVCELEMEGGFEPAAFPSEIEELRSRAVELAAEPLVIAGREALARNDASVVRLVLFTLDQMADTGGWVLSAQQEIAATPVEHFKKLCRDMREDFRSKIIRQPDAAKKNKIACSAELARFRTDVEPELIKISQLLPPGYEGGQEAREEAALLLSGVASGFTWADEFIESEKLYEEALKLAQNTFGAIRIQTSLEEIRSSARQQRLYGKSISSVPSLGSINGTGFTLYGHSDYDAETKSYCTVHYFVFFFLPIFPLGRYRVVNVGDRKYRFLGKLPLRKGDRWHFGIASSAIAIAFVMMIANSNSTSAYSPPTTAPRSKSSPATDSPRASVSATPASPEPSYSEASSYTASSAASDANPNDAELKVLRQRIEAGRSQMTEIDNRLKPVMDEVSSIDEQMQPLKSDLDSLKKGQAEGIDIDTDHYNSLVDDYNSLLRRKKALVEVNGTAINTYEALKKEDESMMEQWKALGGKVE
jgi:hypothetical protein